MVTEQQVSEVLVSFYEGFMEDLAHEKSSIVGGNLIWGSSSIEEREAASFALGMVSHIFLKHYKQACRTKKR